LKCTTYAKIRKILRRRAEILIIRENIKEANAEMKESAEKKTPKAGKERGERAAQCLLQIDHAPFPCPRKGAIFRVILSSFVSNVFFRSFFFCGDG